MTSPAHPSGVPTLQGIDHVAMRVRDVPASVAWYQTTLGMERVHEEAWGDHPAMLRLGTTALALFPAPPDYQPPERDHLPVRHIAFRADADNFLRMGDHLTAMRIEVTYSDHGPSESIYFFDPDGHELEVTRYR